MAWARRASVGPLGLQQEVETDHGVRVELVTVGDAPLDEASKALLAAAREAAVNAAKWSGADVVSIYAEVEPTALSVFVRDRGRGFDPAAVAPDRKGISESIHARVRRCGGTSSVRSSPGQGTEVALKIERPPMIASMTSPSPPRPPAAASAALRVFIVDDHPLFRAGVRHELTAHADRVEVIGEAGDVASAVEQICVASPDVVLVDVHMPGGGGPEVIRQVAVLRPAVRFLALSVSDSADDVIETIRAGARGYVTKTISTAELVEALATVAARGRRLLASAGRVRP